MEQNYQSNMMNLNNVTGGIPTNNVYTNPVQPIQPVYSEPVQPVYTNPVQPIQPVYAEPAQPIQPVYANEPVNIPAAPAPVQAQAPVQEEQSNAVVENVVAHKVVEEKQIINNEIGYYKINTARMQDMIRNINNGIRQSDTNQISYITQLKFTSTGLEVSATNLAITIIQKDRSVLSSEETSIGVDTKLFKALIDRVTDEEITLKYESETKIIKVITSGGEFILREMYDGTTGQAMSIELPEDLLALPTTTIENITEKISILKQICLFSGKDDTSKDVAGVYVETDAVSANDRNNFAFTKKSLELADRTLFFPNDFVDAIKDIDFGYRAEIAYIIDTDRTYPSRFIIKNDDITITGPLMFDHQYTNYPIEGIRKFVETPLTQKLNVNRNAILTSLELTQLFIDSNNDRDVILLSMEKSGFEDTDLVISSKAGTAIQTLRIPKASIALKPKHTYAKILSNTLKAFTSETVEIMGSDEIDHILGLTSPEMIVILSLDQG